MWYSAGESDCELVQLNACCRIRYRSRARRTSSMILAKNSLHSDINRVETKPVFGVLLGDPVHSKSIKRHLPLPASWT